MKKTTNQTLLLLTLMLLTSATTLFAQPTIKETHALKITGRSFGTSIKLRWAPTSMYAWKESSNSGYILERYTVRKNGKMLPVEERSKGQVLTSTPLKPLESQDGWTALMEKNEYAAIAAQALYGESFKMENQKTGLIAQKDDQQNRFAFGLFAADQSVEVAQSLGLYFEDQNVAPGAYYLYKVYPAVAPAQTKIDTGFLYLGTEEVYQLPKVREVETEFENKVAYISWSKALFDQFFTSYVVERSTDGENYQAVNTLPFVGMDKNPDRQDRMVMMDSLDANDLTYYYRVKGKTIFEEYGPPSDPSQGRGINAEVVYPNIESVRNTNNTKLGIGWEFLKANEEEIKGFRLLRANNDQGPYEMISGKILIDKSLRYFIDENPLPVNYYKIAAVDKYDRVLNSFAALAQLDDDTPPEPPVGLRGTIMPDGELVLSWTPNPEADIMGYRIYLANRKDREEYVQITSRPVRQNFFTHLVPMNTLSEEVFIKVRALDFRHNASDFSEVVTITRPDSIAPAAPVFTSARATSEKINVVWENSASVDVVQMILERKAKKSNTWEAIKTLIYPNDINTKNFQDSTVERGALYEYRLQAIDDAGLVTYSRSITASKIDNGIRQSVKTIRTNVDRKQKTIALQWNYLPDGNKLSHFLIYRGVEKDRPRKYDSVKKMAAQKNEGTWIFEDQNLKMDTAYQYQIRAVYSDGAQSPLSKKVLVEY